MLDITQYTDLIPSENASQPNFVAMVSFLCEPFVTNQNILASFPDKFDLDQAVGDQLDILGEWIAGPNSRTIKIPISGNYFELDVAGSGLDEKDWYVTGEALFTSVQLDDDDYRQFLRAKAAANNWDGTINGAYNVYAIFFTGKPTAILIHDYQNMSFALEIIGQVPNDTIMAILNQNYLGLRPECVQQLPTITP